MCLIVVRWSHHPDFRLDLVANRDEFTARPTQAAHDWEEGFFGGRDLQAGGAWIGIAPGHRMACLTNVRDPKAPTGERSRGALVRDYLAGSANPADYISSLNIEDFSPFNLLLLDGPHLWFFNSQSGQAPRRLPGGVYGISNASLNTPWPKTLSVCRAMRSSPRLAYQAMMDTHTYPDAMLPNTGVSPAWEKRLSSARILGDDYATLSTTQISGDGQGLTLTETTHASASVVTGTRPGAH